MHHLIKICAQCAIYAIIARMTDTPTMARWVPETTTFRARLALIRRQMGWNLREASTECGLAPNAWARYEQLMSPRDIFGTVDKIVERTGVDRMWLLTGVPAGQPSDYKATVRLRSASPKQRPRSRTDARRPGETTSRRHHRPSGGGTAYVRMAG